MGGLSADLLLLARLWEPTTYPTVSHRSVALDGRGALFALRDYTFQSNVSIFVVFRAQLTTRLAIVTERHTKKTCLELLDCPIAPPLTFSLFSLSGLARGRMRLMAARRTHARARCRRRLDFRTPPTLNLWSALPPPIAPVCVAGQRLRRRSNAFPEVHGWKSTSSRRVSPNASGSPCLASAA
jgi:hypothetical protein